MCFFVQELSDMELRLRNGGLGGVQNYAQWEAKLMSATNISTMASPLSANTQTLCNDSLVLMCKSVR